MEYYCCLTKSVHVRVSHADQKTEIRSTSEGHPSLGFMVSAFNLGCTGKHVYSVCALFTLKGKWGVISIYSGYFADVLLKPTKGARRLKDSHSSWNQKAFKGLTLVSLHDWNKLTGFSSSTKLVKGPLIGLCLLHYTHNWWVSVENISQLMDSVIISLYSLARGRPSTHS